ncbi:hypothetical protein [Catellatospora methionotrophica]|uniref:hypothetical protein n=1 Tax=Catellatospora methionotrophica TaxID=121620 RepID=UPI00140D2E45|nr:hypothetical protein [Catellatospora methionotrophica]
MTSSDTATPVSATHRRVAWTLFVTTATLAVVGVVGSWNPWRLVVLDRWLDHAPMIWVALPFGVYLLHLRWRGHGPRWSDHPRDRSWLLWTCFTAVLGLVGLAMTVGSAVSAPDERVLATSPDGRHQIVLDQDDDLLFLRSVEGLRSRQSPVPCAVIPVGAAFVEAGTFEVRDEFIADKPRRYSFDPATVQILSTCKVASAG